MALPFFGPIIQALQRDKRHMKDIDAVLQRLRKDFAEEGIPFAIVGALAVRQHGHLRFTEDIDILTTKEGLEKIHSRFGGRGISPRAAGLRKKLYESEHQVNIDVITQGEVAGGAGSPIVFPHPDDVGPLTPEGYRYPTLERLIEFKLASHIWGHRDQDRADVNKLIQINRLDEALAPRLPAALREKYLEILDVSRKEKDIE